MTPTMISGTSQTLTQFPNSTLDSPPQDVKGIASRVVSISVPKDEKQPTVDTVSISDPLRQVVMDVNKDSSLVKKATKVKDQSNETQAAVLAGNEQSGVAVAKVEFMYDVKGELIVKYMDTADRIVYQMPSELMQHMKETAGKYDSSVDTKA